MGNRTFSGARFWGKNEAASIRLATEALTASIDDKLLGKFSSVGDRDNGIGSLTAAQRRGALTFVDGVGWFGHTGSGQVRIGGDMWLQSGFGGYDPESTGLLRIEFPKPFAAGVTPRVWAVHSTSDRGAPVLSVQPYTADGYINASQCHFLVKNNGVAYGNYLEMTWFAHGPRPALV